MRRGTDLSLSLYQDDLVRQVMNELKQASGGDQRQKGEDLVDIEIESGAHAKQAIPSVQSAGEKFCQKLKKKMEEDRRRTLKVGGLKWGEARSWLTSGQSLTSFELHGDTPSRIAESKDESGGSTPRCGGR